MKEPEGDSHVTFIHFRQGGAPVLKFIDLHTLSNAECRRQFAETTEQVVPAEDSQTLCAVSGIVYHGMCHNNGSPLTFENKLIGINIFPSIKWGKCARDLPDGFTRISTHVDWINKQIK